MKGIGASSTSAICSGHSGMYGQIQRRGKLICAHTHTHTHYYILSQCVREHEWAVAYRDERLADRREDVGSQRV